MALYEGIKSAKINKVNQLFFWKVNIHCIHFFKLILRKKPKIGQLKLTFCSS